MAKYAVWGAGIVLTCALAPLPAAAIPPCENLQPAANPAIAYRYRANVPRCEGVHLQQVAGEGGISLVSLTIGQVAFDPARDEHLEIRFSTPPEPQTRIQAVSVPLRDYYRLDMNVDAKGGPIRLPLAVVRQAKIAAPDFGIFGLRRMGQNIGYIPVRALAPGRPAEGNLVAVLRPGGDVSSVKWRLYRRGDIPLPAAWQAVSGADGLVPQGQRLQIVFSTPPAERMTLEVSYLKGRGGDGADKFELLPK